MSSEEVPLPGSAPALQPGEPGHADEASSGEQAGHPTDEREPLNLTDPKAIRALAHPLRWALLEALGQAGTLTATQASEMLGESPANCAFHLRTLGKYGFVEEAGGGRGRERPWRRSYERLSWQTFQADPQALRAAEALDQVFLERSLARARHGLTSIARWPEGLINSLGASTTRLYVTPAEAEELYTEISEVFDRVVVSNHRFADRRDPNLRPKDAIPVEFVLMGYPVLDLPALPEADAADEIGETGPDG